MDPRRITGETWKDYFSLHILNEIFPSIIDECKNSNDSIWFFPGGLMVSSKLMRELQRKGNDLIFREGFGGYA